MIRRLRFSLPRSVQNQNGRRAGRFRRSFFRLLPSVPHGCLRFPALHCCVYRNRKLCFRYSPAPDLHVLRCLCGGKCLARVPSPSHPAYPAHSSGSQALTAFPFRLLRDRMDTGISHHVQLPLCCFLAFSLAALPTLPLGRVSALLPGRAIRCRIPHAWVASASPLCTAL